MKTVFYGLFALVAALVLALAGIYLAVTVGKATIRHGQRAGGVEVIKDGFVSAAIVALGPQEVALVDGGSDREGKALIAALTKRGLGVEAVKAILLTHGDGDHIGAVPLFPNAEVMILAGDVELAEGRVVRGPVGSPKPTGVKITRALKDGDAFALGGTRVEVFAIPGHTPGSAAFLVAGTLFLGDSAEVTSDGKLAAATWLFCADRPLNRASLQGLAMRLEPRGAEIKAIACSHSGLLERGFAPLRDLATTLKH